MTEEDKVKHKPCPIILASTSSYRASLLRQLNIRFTSAAPDYEESDDPMRETLKGEPAALACHHATQKAVSLSISHPDAIVIGSDQTGRLRDEPGSLLHKPGSRSAARTQLSHCSGQAAEFYTSVAVLIPVSLPQPDATEASGFESQDWFRAARTLCSPRHHLVSFVETTTMTFRSLTSGEIDTYLTLDEPYDCAGSFKIEAHGIGLFSRYACTDPSALIGLPLIRLASILRAAGIQPFAGH